MFQVNKSVPLFKVIQDWVIDEKRSVGNHRTIEIRELLTLILETIVLCPGLFERGSYE
jgi:hypothetical protein